MTVKVRKTLISLLHKRLSGNCLQTLSIFLHLKLSNDEHTTLLCTSLMFDQLCDLKQNEIQLENELINISGLLQCFSG